MTRLFFIISIYAILFSCSHNKILFLNESKVLVKINKLQAEIETIDDKDKIKKLEKVEQLNQALFKATTIYCNNTIHHQVGHGTWKRCMQYGRHIVLTCEMIRQEDSNQKLGDCVKGTLYVFE